MTGQIGKNIVIGMGLALIAMSTVTAQPPTRSLIAEALPWGLTWQDVDTVITQKVIAADSSMSESITRPEPGIILIKGTPFSKFTARDLRLHYHDETGIVSGEWRFTGTRILSAIGVYDYLRPALVIELGKPISDQDTSVSSAEELRSSTRSDRALIQKLQKEEVPLSSQWKVKRSGRELIVDLRVDNRSGETVLSIIDSERASEMVALNESDDATTTEQNETEGETVQIADTTSEIDQMSPEPRDEIPSADGEPTRERNPETDTDTDNEEGINNGKPS